MNLETIVGACVAVIIAGMPAMIALLKIKELHIAVNSALTSFIAATKLEADTRFADLKEELVHVRHRNDQLFDQLSAIAQATVVAPSKELPPP